jgi:hypothetical protein
MVKKKWKCRQKSWQQYDAVIFFLPGYTLHASAVKTVSFHNTEADSSMRKHSPSTAICFCKDIHQ